MSLAELEHSLHHGQPDNNNNMTQCDSSVQYNDSSKASKQIYLIHSVIIKHSRDTLANANVNSTFCD